MTLTSGSTIIISDATQLERLTEIREKLSANPASELTLSDCKDFLIALKAELENKADGDEIQPISGTVAVNNFPTTQPITGTVAVSNFPTEEVIAETALTAVGTTPARSGLGFREISIEVVATGIGTNAVLRIEGSNSGNNWVNLSSTNADTTVTLAGTYGFSFTGKWAFYRLKLVSFSGGTPSIIAYLLRGN
jgi:hypothetical protein